MKFKLIIFCALFFSSKFVASISIDEERVRQRALPPSNWQGNQNTAEYHHSPGFAQAHNVHLMTNSHEYNANQGGQRIDNYGFNKTPLKQQAVPKRERQIIFAEDANKPVGLLPREDFYSVGSVNQPIKVDERQNKQNRQAQNHFVNTASSPSAGAVAGHESSPLVRELHYNSGHIHKNNWPVNRQHLHPEIPPAIVRGAYYHPSQIPHRVAYSQGHGPEFGIYNRPVRYENYNEAHAATLNANQPKFSNNGHVENPASYPGPGNVKRYEAYNHFSSNIPRNRLSQAAPSNINAPSSYTARIMSSDTLLNNQGYEQKPVINSKTNNRVPNTFETPIELPNIKPDNIGIPNNSAPKMDNAYEDGHVLVSKPNHDLPNQDNAAIVPMITELNKPDNVKFDGEIPVTDFGSVNQPSEANYNKYVPTVESIALNNDENPSVNPLPLIDGFREERPISSDTSLQTKQRNPTNLFIRNKANNLLTHNHNHFTIIHPNGTVQNIDDLERLTQNNPKYILLKKEDHSRVDNNKVRSSLTILPTENHALDNEETIQDFLDSLKEQIKRNGEPPSSNVYNPLTRSPSTYNPLPQPPNDSDDEYYMPPQHPSDNYYNPLSRPLTENHYNPPVQSPNSYGYIESSAIKSNKDNDDISVPQSETTNNYINDEKQVNDSMLDYESTPQTSCGTHTTTDTLQLSTSTITPPDSNGQDKDRTLRLYPYQIYKHHRSISSTTLPPTTAEDGVIKEFIASLTEATIDDSAKSREQDGPSSSYDSSTFYETATGNVVRDEYTAIPIDTWTSELDEEDINGSVSTPPANSDERNNSKKIHHVTKPPSIEKNGDDDLERIPDKKHNDDNEGITTVKDIQSNSDSDLSEQFDATIIDKLLKMYNATLNIYLVHVAPAQPILERNKATTTFANGTVIQEFTETTWQSKNDTEPTVVTMKKVDHHHGDDIN